MMMGEHLKSHIVLEAHAQHMAVAFLKLLGEPAAGTIAFTRCLSREVINGLCESQKFALNPWRVWAVVESADKSLRQITADQAVALREDKGNEPILLLVDLNAAGAGMDGIYSAGREIKESDLFKEGEKAASKGIRHGWSRFAQDVVKEAQRRGGRGAISPWRRFDFLTRCAINADDMGRLVTRLRLWPIKIDGKPNPDDLSISASLVEKLILSPAQGRSAQSRVEALTLNNPSPEARTALERLIRESIAFTPDEAVARLERFPEVWLNQIRPMTIDGQLQIIDWVSWRGKNGIAQWSGLTDDGENLPQFLITPNKTDVISSLSRLEVRWSTQPQDLEKSTVEYRITVVAGDEELAAKTIPHAAKKLQSVVFTNEDFGDLDENARYEAKVRISAVGVKMVEPAESDEFLLCFGEKPPDKTVTAGTGKAIRSPVEGAITLPTEEEFDQACIKPPNDLFSEDKKGYVLYRPKSGQGGFKVPRPALLKVVEESWHQQPDKPVRWIVRVRADGSTFGAPSRVELERESCPEETFERLCRASKRFCEELMRGPGAVAKIYAEPLGVAEEYVNAWHAALEKATPKLALAQTVEVQSLSEQTIGLVVLPTHPLRVAWHMAYDQLARHARYSAKMKPADVLEALKGFDSAHFPSILPGCAPGYSFVFGDTLGFHAVAMVRDDDDEPKAAVSQIAACLAKDQPEMAPSVGAQAADLLAREFKKYVEHHDPRRLLLVNALRPGDGMTLGRALGQVAGSSIPDGEDDDTVSGRKLGFVVELFSGEIERGQTGRFFTQVVERRRSGTGGVDPRDRWMLESVLHEGGISLPRLRWAKRSQEFPDRASHLAVAFDTFKSRVEAITRDDKSPRPFQAYGLIAHMERRWNPIPTPKWISCLPTEIDGEKHPANRVFTERLWRMQRVVSRTSAIHCGGDENSWPALVTKLSPSNQDSLSKLHQLSDWVVTIDRNAGVEYFDSPHEQGDVYGAYVIDCVPERDDLGNLQMITSTTRMEEVQALLDQTLGQMGLSSSPQNCQFLLNHLKALSGRLAIRLTNRNAAAGELVALAAVYANCIRSSSDNDDWLPVTEGFFVPLDDVRDLQPAADAQNAKEQEVDPNHRADLLFVSTAGRGGLRLCFVEVKYRRHLSDAEDPELARAMAVQATSTSRRWNAWYFNDRLPELTRSTRRGRLARALRFYADKARRHDLSQDAYQRLVAEIDKMIRLGVDYVLSPQTGPDRGYVFCPEFDRDAPRQLPVKSHNTCKVFIFGPDVLPMLLDGPPKPKKDFTEFGLGAENAPSAESFEKKEEKPRSQEPPVQSSTNGDVESQSPPSAISPVSSTPISSSSTGESSTNKPTIEIILGESVRRGTNATWSVGIQSNPHLMIVGLPGMGKTTCLVNICRQFVAAGIAPIVFSYHQDLDAKLAESLQGVRFLDHATLGFNPLHIADDNPTAYIDSAGMMRDIFAAIFPDLGDIQTGKMRTAIKESYEKLGWKTGVHGRGTPPFRDFYLRLKSEDRPDRGLLTRLEELDDYGVFESAGNQQRLLDDSAPVVVKVHATQNERLQRALAALIFYGIYKDMFRRGPQHQLTHAIIFDEAHRASKLKLLPTMAKECRKYGISLVVASQEARDFDDSLYSAIANYLCLRVTEHDAKTIAKHCVDTDQKNQTTNELKALSKYQALFFREGETRPTHIALGKSP
jgi:DNA phosphorothioation-dependent restriction protein DptH